MKTLCYSYLCEDKNVLLFSDIKFLMQFLLFTVLQMQVIWVWRAKDDKLSLSGYDIYFIKKHHTTLLDIALSSRPHLKWMLYMHAASKFIYSNRHLSAMMNTQDDTTDLNQVIHLKTDKNAYELCGKQNCSSCLFACSHSRRICPSYFSDSRKNQNSVGIFILISPLSLFLSLSLGCNGSCTCNP